MAMKLSRRKLAANAAARITGGESKTAVLGELAAYLITNNRKKESDLIVRDIEAMLIASGVAVGTVISARQLNEAAIKTVESYVKQVTGTTTVVLREKVDETLLGGVRLELPGHQLDASVKAKLELLTV